MKPIRDYKRKGRIMSDDEIKVLLDRHMAIKAGIIRGCDSLAEHAPELAREVLRLRHVVADYGKKNAMDAKGARIG